MRHPALLVAGLVVLSSTGACAKASDAEGTPGDSVVAGALPEGHPSLSPAAELSAAARLMLDSGNTEFRAARFDGARRYYEKAAQLAPKHGAPWFGIFMIGDATKNKALADSAMAEVQKRTGGTAAPSHPDTVPKSPHGTFPKT